MLAKINKYVLFKNTEKAEREVILRLSKIYSSSTNKLLAGSIVSKQVINTRDLVMHGTNGFVFLSSCLAGTKILPAYEREKIGIPT